MKLTLTMLGATLLIACSTGETITAPANQGGRTEAQVIDVVDGETIDVLIGGAEPYGKEASARNRGLVEGATMWLEKDVSETDRFDRLLRYVWLEDGAMVNEALVAEGYAQVSTFPPGVKYVDRFLAAQGTTREARSQAHWAPLTPYFSQLHGPDGRAGPCNGCEDAVTA